VPTFPVSQPIGTRVYGPFTITSSQSSAFVKFTKWGNTATVLDIDIEVSLDAGTSWQSVASGRGFTGGGTGRFADPSISLGPIPLICGICGNLYLPGIAAYTRALSHSTVTLNPGVTLAQIAAAVGYPVNSLADIQLRILVDTTGHDVDAQYVTRTFHTPVLDANAPNRQMRVTATVAGAALTTTLDVTLGA
jgi:hypothetical protein